MDKQPDNDDAFDFGPCCAYGQPGPTVRNIITLTQRAPVSGTGWGCLQCGLPSDGAIAVLCDACMEASAPIRFVCVGYSSNGQRVRVETLSEKLFDHDLSKHPEETPCIDEKYLQDELP